MARWEEVNAIADLLWMASLLGDGILPSSGETLHLLLHEFERGPYQVHCQLLRAFNAALRHEQSRAASTGVAFIFKTILCVA